MIGSWMPFLTCPASGAATMGALAPWAAAAALAGIGSVAVLLVAARTARAQRDAEGGLARYVAILAARDGAPDFARRTLAHRESFFASLDSSPLAARAPIDRATFLRNLARARPERGLDERALFLLATAKSNVSERYGVELAERLGRMHAGREPVLVHVTLQEHYHTRMLADVVRAFGLPVPDVRPPLAARAVVHAILALPERLGLPLTGASEMAGCILFRMLRDRGREIFADEPAVAARIALLYDEILIDEIGHVGLIAWQLGRVGRAAMRFLYRAVARFMLRAMPEMRTLVGDAAIARATRGAFPLDDLLRDLGGRAFALARP